MSDYRLTAVTRAYRVALALLLPTRFHRRFAHQMLDVFAEREADARERLGTRGALAALWSEIPDLARLAFAERRAERATRRRAPAPSPRSAHVLESIAQDLRFAARALRRSPAFASVAILTLALGIGANTAIFSIVDGVLLRPLPMRDPARLVAVGEESKSGPAGSVSVTSPANLFDWKQSSRTMDIAGFDTRSATLTGHGEPRVLAGTRSIGGILGVLGAQPLFGRLLTTADEDPASPPVVVLSYATWRELFGGDRGALGSVIVLDGTARTIVGVMSPSFSFLGGRSEFYVPARFDAQFRENRDQYFIQVVGRLRPSATIERARSEMAGIAARLRHDWPTYNTDLRIVVVPLRETIVGDTRTPLLVIMGAVGFVLLITCANLGNLLLARAAARRREIAVRQVLGAGQARVARQLLTESVLLAALGGVAGLAVGKSLLALLRGALATANVPRVDEIALDGRVLAFTLVVSLIAGLVFGSIPAWQLAGERASLALREGSRGNTGSQLARSVLVVSEMALAMVLLIGAGLLLRSLALLQRVNPGITPEHLLTFDIGLPQQNPTFFPTSLERIQALPGVRSAALVSQLPVTGRGIGAWFNRIDRPLPPDVEPTGEAYRVVTPEFFSTVGMKIERGRLLQSTDRHDAPVVVINEALARKYYRGEDPLGKPIYLGAPDNRLFDRGTIVGVVSDTRDAGLGSDPLPTVYIPLSVMPSWPQFSYVVRTVGEPTAVASEVRAAIRQLDPSLPIRDLATMDDVLSTAVAPARLSTLLLSAFATMALVIAVLGVFGVLSFLVSQRTRELGIRIALGAEPSQVRRMLLARGMVLVVIGVALGTAGAMALTRFMASLLYGVTATDPVTYAGVALVLAATAVVASWVPARRATSVDPMVALRSE